MACCMECCTNDEDESEMRHVRKHKYFIQKAADLALKSDLVNHRHGCVIVSNRGKIISEGYNYRWKEMSIHAEVSAISQIHKKKKIDLSNCTMYVVRIGTDRMGNPLKYSKPCENCTHAILKSGLRKVFYSTNYEFIMCSELIEMKNNTKKK